MSLVAAPTLPSHPPNPREARWARRFPPIFIGLVVLLQAGQTLPPLLLEGRAPLPGILIAATAVTIIPSVHLLDRLHRPRERWGTLTGVLVLLAVSMVIGAATGALVIELFARLALVMWQIPMVDPGGVITVDDLGRLGMSKIRSAAAFIGAGFGVFQFGLWAAGFVLPSMARRERASRDEVAHLRLQAEELRASAELARLRAQLEPHFLLNTLNLIAGLVGSDPERARGVIAALGDLLQDALSTRDDEHSVGEEIAWLRRYVSILEVRHAPHLAVTWSISAEAEGASIPRLVLQPLVENGALHGALRRKGGGRLHIEGEVRQGTLVCRVRDDGPGLAGPTRPGAVGVDNVRRRLALLGPSASLDLASSSGEGTVATISLPFVLHAAAVTDGSTLR